MMNKISFDDFVKYVEQNYADHSFEYRYGQTLMNTLHKLFPEKHSSITNTNYDCFYDDGIVAQTYQRLKNDW